METNVIVETSEVEGEGVLFRSVVADQIIDEFAANVSDYDLSTPEGYEGNKSAIKWCTTMRSKVSEYKKVLNEKALAHQRKVNKEESRLIDRITEIETPLRKKKADFDNAAEAKKKEMEAQREAMIKDRQDYFFSETGQRLAYTDAETWTQQQYESALHDGRIAKRRAKEEADRLDKEEADRKETVRLAQEKLDADQKELKRQQDELQAARDELQAAKDALAKQQRDQEEREQAARDVLAKQQEQAKPKPFHDAHMQFLPVLPKQSIENQEQARPEPSQDLSDIRSAADVRALGRSLANRETTGDVAQQDDHSRLFPVPQPIGTVYEPTLESSELPDDQVQSLNLVEATIQEIQVEEDAEQAVRIAKLALLLPKAALIRNCFRILFERIHILEELLDQGDEGVLAEYLDDAGAIKVSIEKFEDELNAILDERGPHPSEVGVDSRS